MATPFSVFYFPLLGTPTAEGNQLTFYEAGLDVPLNVFTDSDGLIPWSQPIVLNAAGEADGVIYVDPDGPALKVVYVDANGVAVPGYPVDNIPPGEILNVTTVSTTVLTDAQIKALPTTPITLIAAPASGLRIRVFALSLNTNTSAGAYTNLNASYVDIHTQVGADYVSFGPVNDATSTPALTLISQILGTTVTSVYDVNYPNASGYALAGNVGYVQNNILWNKTTVNGVALTIAMDNNGSGNLTGGNAANTMTVTVYYCLESV